MALRHSPSTAIATWPLLNGLSADHSSPKLLRNFSILSYPYQSVRSFCQVSSVFHAGSAPTAEVPSGLVHFAPTITPVWMGAFSYIWLVGTKPATLMSPLESLTVSFLARSASSLRVLG